MEVILEVDSFLGYETVTDFAIDTGRNICHGSDSVESAEREISLWFSEGLVQYASHSQSWILELD